MHYLYKITCLVNQKNYIGQAADPVKRWSQHKSEASRDVPRMIVNRAMKKHGAHNFTFEVIATCLTMEDANELETHLVSQYESHVSTGKGYNVSLGGSNAPKTEEWKAAQSALRKGKHYCPRTQFKAGHQFDAATRIKIGAANKLWKRSAEHLAALRAGRLPVSEETRERLRQANLGKTISPEQRQKIARSLKGRRNTPEQMARHAEVIKAKGGYTFDLSQKEEIRKKHLEGSSINKLRHEYQVSFYTIKRVLERRN
jgi:group I intron endonuclease